MRCRRLPDAAAVRSAGTTMRPERPLLGRIRPVTSQGYVVVGFGDDLTSNKPKRTRQARISLKFFTTPIVVMQIPQQTIRAVSHKLGRTFLRMALDGISTKSERDSIVPKWRFSLTKDDIWNEENRADNVVLIPNKTKVFVHAFYLSIPDISTVNVRYEIQKTHHRYEPKIDLRHDTVSPTLGTVTLNSVKIPS